MSGPRDKLATPRPHPVGKVVTGAAAGGGILGTLVLAAGLLLDMGDVLPFSPAVNATVRSVATLVAMVGGALAAGRRSQTAVEADVTPLEDPLDAHGRKLVPEPPAMPQRRRRPAPPQSWGEHDAGH